ncbi:MAG: SDR family oxidoreductase [Bacilli bacterium]|nr:SDR family oxidoreductase [Bacilli bacterium]
MDYSQLENKRILVTGGAGFIGSNIVKRLLDLGCYVKVLDNLITGKKENIEEFMNNDHFEFIEGDIRDFNLCLNVCDDIDYVLHEAALGSVPRSIENPLLSHDINVNGFVNMLYASVQKKVKRFIYASSSSVYGDLEKLPKVEQETGNPLSPYALNKKVDELYALLFNKIYNIETIGLRYFNVYGPKQDPKSKYAAVIPLFINNIVNNQKSYINGDGTNTRDFTYVQDVVNANVNACLADSSSCGNVYNIAYGGRVTIQKLYDMISEILGIFIDPLYREERIGDIKHSNADIQKAKEKILYNPIYSIEEGLKKTINWYKKKTNYELNPKSWTV